jgi:hypothetical protein
MSRTQKKTWLSHEDMEVLIYRENKFGRRINTIQARKTYSGGS